MWSCTSVVRVVLRQHVQLPVLEAVGPVNPATGKWCREQHGISWNTGTAVLVLVGLQVLCQLQGMLEASCWEQFSWGNLHLGWYLEGIWECLCSCGLSWVFGGIERAFILYVKIILVLFISLEFPKNTV